MKPLEKGVPLLLPIKAVPLLLVFLLFAGPSPANVHQIRTGDVEEAARLTERAVKMIEAGELVAAIDELDLAIEADEEYWEAWYQKGRALGLLEQFGESRDVLLRAAELNPGHGHTHRLAAVAAARAEDYTTAWDQAIRASLAGQDMNQLFVDMFYKSPPPDDFEVRIEAAKVFVASSQTDEIDARAELPYNRNPQSGGSGTISGRPDYVMGSDRVNESAADIARMERSFRVALSDSPYFGVVLNPQWADYVLVVSIDEVGERAPLRLSGYVRLYDIVSGDVVWYRSIKLDDISAQAVTYGELARFVNLMSLWLREEREGW
jgi:tetratricopeptide (TPR) repeat protein